MKNSKTLLIVINVDWLFLLHRLPIAIAAKNDGFRVIVAAKDTGKASLIEKEGLEFVNLEISRSGTNPLKELKSFLHLFKIYKKIKPDVLYQITMKPVVYGSVIAKVLRLKNVNGISGLGYNFSGGKKSIVQKIMAQMMKFGFSKKNIHFIFENEDDLNELNKNKIIKSYKNTTVVKGVGVNLEKYKPARKIFFLDKLVFLLPTRMLWDKGVKEFIESAKQLEEEYKGKVLFRLCGMLDEDNKEFIPEEYLISNRIDGYIQWDGHQENTYEMYRDSDIIVLPSYREGMPTVLLEAAAMGKPIITTDAPGCKDCVDEGVNGYKVPVKSIKDLRKTIERMINLTEEDRELLGKYSREKSELVFDIDNVIKTHLNIFQNLSNK